jgi:chorismate dehydratase
MESLRLAVVRYLNTLPLIEGLDKLRGLTLLPAAPSSIAGMVREGTADVGLASIIDAAGDGAPLTLLPVGMIGCDGPTMTVRVYSRVPWREVRTLHADVESHTSVVLAQVVLRARFAITPEVEPLRAHDRDTLRTHETMLLIGDKVVHHGPGPDDYPHQLDLGQAWKEWTGLPFVYATWMCRTDRAAAEPVSLACALLDRQRRHNATRLEWIVESRAPEHRWPVALAREYLTRLLRYDMTPSHREAAERFVAEAAALGLCARTPLHWHEASGVETRA